jgi:hypothetical protein
MEKLDAISNWIKSNPLTVSATALAGLLGALITANNFFDVTLKRFDIPACFTHANVYRDQFSYFKREGDVWREYRNEDGSFMNEFKELHRDRDNIDLLNLTDRGVQEPRWKTLKIRIPVCGGTARISLGIPEHWQDLYDVYRN